MRNGNNEKMLVKLMYTNCIYGHTDKRVAGSHSKSAKPACVRALLANQGKVSGTASRSCQSRACPALIPSALGFTLSLPAQGPTSSPTLPSKSDNVSFSFFHSHDTLWDRHFKEIIKWMNSYQSKLKAQSFVFRPSNWTSFFLLQRHPSRFTCTWLLGRLGRGRSQGTGFTSPRNRSSLLLKALWVLNRSWIT